MTRYAEDTTVPASRSRDEIERTLDRYGASAFHYSREEVPSGVAVGIEFKLQGHLVRLAMLLPSSKEARFTLDTRGYHRSENAARELWEKATRQRWRALALVVKAKLEAIESGIVVPGTDETVGQRIIPAIKQGRTVPALPAGPITVEVVE